MLISGLSFLCGGVRGKAVFCSLVSVAFPECQEIVVVGYLVRNASKSLAGAAIGSL